MLSYVYVSRFVKFCVFLNIEGLHYFRECTQTTTPVYTVSTVDPRISWLVIVQGAIKWRKR